MLALRSIPKYKWLAAGNGLVALVVVIPAARAFFSMVAPSPNSDIDAFGYALLAILVCVPVAGLFILAAAAHLGRWPLRWVLQAIAVVLPVCAIIVLYPTKAR